MVDRVASREEQARADGPAEADHHEVASVHAAFQRGDTSLAVGAAVLGPRGRGG